VSRKLISSGSVFEEQIGYSRAVVDGDYVFVSGTTGYDYSTMSISGDVTEQAEQCLRNIKTTLETAGCTLGDVVRVTYIFPNKDDFAPCWPVLRAYLAEARPAATMIVAGLMDEAMKLEIQVTAKLPR
jgi:enamine deaminase RidA (YjgF/YER057c/UK114 family)